MRQGIHPLTAHIKKHQQDQGFTLIEVVISGLVMGAMMVSVAQLAGKSQTLNNSDMYAFS